MSEINYNKLVRDNIPEIIKQDGATPVTRYLDTEEYKRALLEKLIEEAKELLASGGNIEERADIAEVLAAIDETFGLSFEAIEQGREIKARSRGRFTLRLFLEKIIDPDVE